MLNSIQIEKEIGERVDEGVFSQFKGGYHIMTSLNRI